VNSRPFREDEAPSGHPVVRQPDAVSAPDAAILAEIDSEVGDGVYTWTRYKGRGPSEGEATELNGSTGIVAGTRVVLHKAEGTYYFFFPVSSCS
jgi:hypothetical protein